MGLFKLGGIEKIVYGKPEPVVGFEDLEIEFAFGQNLSAISPLLENLKDGQAIYFMTDGAWSNIDIIEKILSVIGSATVEFCTWSISTEAIRKFTHWQDTRYINNLNVLLDMGIRNRKPEIYQQATSAFKNLKLIKCHAKVCVLQNAINSFTVIGSANFTNNPRKEAGMIIRNKTIADANIAWIRKEFDNE